jgi:succinate dehydrogenase / fumarate reductase cytochrome b subunit
LLILRKAVIALTGLFICLFLTVHLAGNLILLLPETQAMPLYNLYSETLSANPFITVVAYVNYACFIFHIVFGILVSLKNIKGRNARYTLNHASKNSPWSSRNMGLLGVAILIFTVIHLGNFWFKIKFGEADDNIYGMVVTILGNPYFACLYTLAMIPLGLHLSHGVAAAFKTLGFYHHRYLIWVARAGLVYSIILSALFALIPIVVYARSSL